MILFQEYNTTDFLRVKVGMNDYMFYGTYGPVNRAPIHVLPNQEIEPMLRRNFRLRNDDSKEKDHVENQLIEISSLTFRRSFSTHPILNTGVRTR